MIRAYADAVGVMKQRSAVDRDDPTGWSYQASIHALPPGTPADAFQNQCQHGSWFFLPWHRIYLHWFEEIVRDIVRTKLPNVSQQAQHLGPPVLGLLPRRPERALAQAPARLRTPTNAEGSPNPLFTSRRNTRPGLNMNAGAPLLDRLVATRARDQRVFAISALPGQPNGFGGPVAGWHHDPGPAGSLELTPHGDVAPGARLMPLRSSAGLGSQDEADAFAWAADHGADVISCSWGPADGRWWDPGDRRHDQVVPLPDSRLAIGYAVRTGRGGKGCVVVWAAGNGNESVDNDGYASNPEVIAVAACNDSGARSAYSDHGAAIAVAFPSNDFRTDTGPVPRTPGIWTTDRGGRQGFNPGNPTRGDAAGHYTNAFGGTSSACPGVAGVAALVLSAAPQLGPRDVRDILQQSATRIGDVPGEYDGAGHSDNYGHGRVDAAAAVRLAHARLGP